MQVSGEMKINIPYKPVLVIDEDALAKVQYMVKKHNLECQWWHLVHRIEKDDNIIYYLEDLFIPEQWVGGADVESDDEMWGKMWQEIRKERNLKGKELNPLMQAANAWCHSHHTMQVLPSSTDDTQWKKQKDLAIKGGNSDVVQVMIILNKRNECFNRVWDPILGIEFEKVPVRLHTPAAFKEIDEIIQTKFKTKPAVATVNDIKNTSALGPKAIKINGHAAVCACPECYTVAHVSHCPCAVCETKKKHGTGWKSEVYGTHKGNSTRDGDKKNVGPNSARDSISTESSTTESKDDKKNDKTPFYFNLSGKEWSRLKGAATKLNKLGNIEKSNKLARSVVEFIETLIDTEDMFTVYHILKGNEDKTQQFEKWYYGVSAEEKAQRDYKSLLIECLTIDPIDPPDLLPRAVTLAMRLGGMAALDDFQEVLAEYYESYHPEYLEDLLNGMDNSDDTE